ncbi:hypothetical protein BZG21_34785, partial [Escherichia coli]|nr:hypothetical protein [Escherichia coli]
MTKNIDEVEPPEADNGQHANAVLEASPHTAPIPVHMHIAEDDTDEQITAKLRRQGVRLGKGGIAPAVFWPALLVILAVAVFAILAPNAADTTFNAVQN